MENQMAKTTKKTIEYTKKKDIKDTGSLIHAWANGLLDPSLEYKKGNCEVINGHEFYYYGERKAYFNDKYKCFFIDNFSRSGSYGNGLSSCNLTRAIPPNKQYCPHFLNENTLEDKALFLKWYKEEFIERHRRDFENISHIKEFAINNRLSSPPYLPTKKEKQEQEQENSNIFDLPKEIIKKYKKDISKIKITEKFSYTKFNGWGKDAYTEYSPIELNHTIKQLENKDFNLLDSFLTNEEKKIIKIKKWRFDKCSYTTTKPSSNRWHRHSTSRNFVLSLKEALEIYDDLEKRAYYESLVKDHLEIERKNRKRKAQAEFLKEKENNLKLIKDFREGKTINFYRMNYSFDLIKLTDNDRVKTSSSVVITLKEAKFLYDMFSNYINTGNKYEDKVGKIKIQGFMFFGFHISENILDLNEDDTDFIIHKELHYVKIGCHKITWNEAQKFVKNNNLDW